MGLVALATACSVYEGNPADPRGGSSGSAGSSASGGAAGAGGTTPSGTGGVSGTGGEGGSAGIPDAAGPSDARGDGDATPTDIAAARDTSLDGVNDGVDTGGGSDTPTYDTTGSEDADAAPSDTATDPIDEIPPADAAPDVAVVDADGASPSDAGAPDAQGTSDVTDAGPTLQILPYRGTPIEKPDAGAPFHSRCASDEVVTGFIARAGVQTDAIGATCSKLAGTTLSSPRNLPLNGNVSGGNQVTIACPAGYAAVGIVGRYGHNSTYNEDVTTSLGVVCKSLTSSSTQIVSITTQPALDSGYTSFREDCNSGLFLTDIAGRPDSNSLAYCVGQVGGECSSR